MINIFCLKRKSVNLFFYFALFSFLRMNQGHSQDTHPITTANLGPPIQTKFDSIKDVIKNDLLEEEVKKKAILISKKKKIEHRLKIEKYQFPQESDFWSFMSEYWLIKNAQKLNWDFDRPDYGLEETAKEIFSRLGYFEKKMKLLLINTFITTHFSLPSDNNEYIFLLSRPFIRSLDLTKVEISLLLLEDFFRIEMGYFKNFVLKKEWEEKFGKNFYGQKWDPSLIERMLKNYDVMVLQKGFSFQQQYEVTQKMNSVLKGHLQLRDSYLSLINKIDLLIKSRPEYKVYNKIYPSPEIQMKWLTPNSEKK